MMEKRFVSSLARPLLLAGAVAIILCFLVVPVMSSEGIDPDADKILKSNIPFNRFVCDLHFGIFDLKIPSKFLEIILFKWACKDHFF